MVVKSSRPPDELLDEFVRIAHRIVWCTLVTVDRHGRPRSRVVHPYWERTGDGLTGWAFTRPTTPKVAHLARTPFVSCSYWDPAQEVAVAECAAALADDPESRRHVWEFFSTAAEPLGFDPKIMGGVDHLDPVVTVLRFTPWRLATLTGAWERVAELSVSSAR
ncbi:MAG TPA: pyridoxamine 5'-phosphate oxidase family protein [Actinophytocola sp.]|jgi:general stress protein 26|uniref:pyridoxamine 5'-phosphate oxidase family protein n=1 Tax=Actinophytocola sp. TaxID=1872138 RepID=UPI002F91FF9C